MKKLKSTKISFRVNANDEGIKNILETLEKTGWVIRNVEVDDSKYILDMTKNKLIKVS